MWEWTAVAVDGVAVAAVARAFLAVGVMVTVDGIAKPDVALRHKVVFTVDSQFFLKCFGSDGCFPARRGLLAVSSSGTPYVFLLPASQSHFSRVCVCFCCWFCLA